MLGISCLVVDGPASIVLLHHYLKCHFFCESLSRRSCLPALALVVSICRWWLNHLLLKLVCSGNSEHGWLFCALQRAERSGGLLCRRWPSLSSRSCCSRVTRPQRTWPRSWRGCICSRGDRYAALHMLTLPAVCQPALVERSTGGSDCTQ